MPTAPKYAFDPSIDPRLILEGINPVRRTLLLYLETRAVDHAGMVAGSHLSEADFETVRKWAEEGFVQFAQIKFGDLSERTLHPEFSTHVVKLSDLAWTLAAMERRRRAERTLSGMAKKTLRRKAG